MECNTHPTNQSVDSFVLSSQLCPGRRGWSLPKKQRRAGRKAVGGTGRRTRQVWRQRTESDRKTRQRQRQRQTSTKRRVCSLDGSLPNDLHPTRTGPTGLARTEGGHLNTKHTSRRLHTYVRARRGACLLAGGKKQLKQAGSPCSIGVFLYYKLINSLDASTLLEFR